MRSIGNDIVALAATDGSRTCHHRFYSRILAVDELSLYDERLPFATFVWLMWSIKESAYKYISRADHGLIFAPLKIPVIGLRRMDGYYAGVIGYGRMTLYARSYLNDETILTLVNEENDLSQVRWGLHAIGDTGHVSQSARVRAFALESLSTVFPDADLRIVRTGDGPPEIWDGDAVLDIPISLAHHDRYVAWSYRLPLNNSSNRKSAAN